jgi:preprotein translocase subunit SecE
LWRQGYLVRIKNYVEETREELRKCTWPSWDELKGSTVVVLVSVVLLGSFTVAAEIVIARGRMGHEIERLIGHSCKINGLSFTRFPARSKGQDSIEKRQGRGNG